VTARLLLVRHGITDWNREGRFQGRLDPPLSADGRHEAQLLAERLVEDGDRPSLVVSSPLTRALETARILAGGSPVMTDARLTEIAQGAWEGRTHTELERDDRERYARWRASRGAEPPPDGEALAAAGERGAAGVDAAVAAERWPLCLVAHGGILRLIAAHLLALDPRRGPELDVDNASLGVLARDGDVWVLERWNDTRHLLGRAPIHVAEEEGRPLAL
jgi:broad specificity phosphatase PhoE